MPPGTGPARFAPPRGCPQQLLLRRHPNRTQLSDQETGATIEAIFKARRKRYGYRRIREELSDQGVVYARQRVRRIMNKRRQVDLQPMTLAPRTSDSRADEPSANLLLNTALPGLPDQVWAGDITLIPTSVGWLYQAVVMDLCSRKIVGWALADCLHSRPVVDALR